MNILFICTSNLHRSRTAEDYFKSQRSSNIFKSAGLSEKYCRVYGTRLCTVELLQWADKVFVMEDIHLKGIVSYTEQIYISKIEVLDIDDIYKYMEPGLLKMLKSKVHFTTRNSF
jgi:predicted protein tyrosine phosphatase